MNEIIVELITLIETYLAGCYTECGGNVSIDCENSCKHYDQCNRNSDFSIKLADLKTRASGKNITKWTEEDSKPKS